MSNIPKCPVCGATGPMGAYFTCCACVPPAKDTDMTEAEKVEVCQTCGEPRKEHSLNGACYGVCGEFVASAHTAGDVEPVAEPNKAAKMLCETFRKWLDLGPKKQPHFPNGLRPWSTGDLQWMVEELSTPLYAHPPAQAPADAEAMRQIEPTPEMIEAGCVDMFGAGAKPDEGWPDFIKEAAASCFNAMIRALPLPKACDKPVDDRSALTIEVTEEMIEAGADAIDGLIGEGSEGGFKVYLLSPIGLEALIRNATKAKAAGEEA